MFKAAIIGCGMIAGKYETLELDKVYSHAKAYLKNPKISDIAFYSLNINDSQALAQKYNGTAFVELQSLLDEYKPDIVSICSPDETHFKMLELLSLAQYSPKIIFCEKPICFTKKEFSLIQEIDKKIPILVNHSRRYDHAHQKLAALIQNNYFGSLIGGHIYYYGGWMHLGIHIIDLLLMLFIDPITLIRLNFCCSTKHENDPVLDCLLNIGNTSLRMTGVDERHYQLLELNLLFEEGQVKIANFGEDINLFKKEINQEQERVLVQDNTHHLKGMESPITNAVSLIVRYLEHSDRTLLTSVNLQSVEKTMYLLWEGIEKYEAKHK